MKKEVTIYTDGACSGNPGPGGWGAILIYGKIEKEISGGAESTTNNRMELTAVIEALKLLKYPCSVTLYSDSQYVINSLEKGWAKKWKENNWVKSDKSKALNPDLWDTLLEETEKHEPLSEKAGGMGMAAQNEPAEPSPRFIFALSQPWYSFRKSSALLTMQTPASSSRKPKVIIS